MSRIYLHSEREAQVILLAVARDRAVIIKVAHRKGVLLDVSVDGSD